jgi:GH15 family glucan-1,4-alpha-glucosidase
MAWVAFDRVIKDAERDDLDAPLERWRRLRDQIHAEVCERGFDAGRNTFVQSYESAHLDASLLLIPQVGFLPPDDPRVLGTIAAIERGLIIDGLVLRYSTETDVDALPAGEGAFLPCSFWLADCYALTGRRAQAEALFERLLSLRNDVGLLAEEYDPRTGRMLGNFPQALTHMALVNTARLLSMPVHEAQNASAQGERPASASAQAAPAGDHDTAADDAMDPKRSTMPTEPLADPLPRPSNLKSN